MRFAAIDEWRKWNARKRAPFRHLVSLDALTEEGAAAERSNTGTVAGSAVAPRPLDAKADADYLVWYLERHRLWLSLAITLLVMAGYSQREAASFLGVTRESYRDNLLPRWRANCQLILSS